MWVLGILCAFAFAFGGDSVRTASISSARKGLWNAKATYPVFTSDSETRRIASQTFKQDAEKTLGEFVRNARGFAASGQKPIAPWELSQSAVVALNSASLVSGYAQTFDYSGGAHPNRYYRAINVAKIGNKVKRIKLSDVIKPGEDLEEFATENIVPELNRMKRARGIDGIVYEVDEKLLDNFVITPAGITWLFGPYDVGAYVEGEYFVKVSWLKLLRELGPNSIVKPWADVAAKEMLTEFHVSWQDSYKLPPGAWVEFQLVSPKSDGTFTLLQRQKLPIAQQNQRFSLKWLRSRMSEGGEFQIQISIWVESTKLYQNGEAIPVTSEGFEQLQNIALVPVHKSSGDDEMNWKKFVRLGGELVYREKISLPPSAYSEFRIYKQGESFPVSIKTFSAKNPPIPFDVTFDISKWDVNKTYFLEIAIIADAKTWFVSEKILVPITGWESAKTVLLTRRPQ